MNTESLPSNYELLEKLTYADNRELLRQWEQNLDTITRHTILTCSKLSIPAGEYSMFVMRHRRKSRLKKSKAKQVARLTQELNQESNQEIKQEKKL